MQLVQGVGDYKTLHFLKSMGKLNDPRDIWRLQSTRSANLSTQTLNPSLGFGVWGLGFRKTGNTTRMKPTRKLNLFFVSVPLCTSVVSKLASCRNDIPSDRAGLSMHTVASISLLTLSFRALEADEHTGYLCY